MKKLSFICCSVQNLIDDAHFGPFACVSTCRFTHSLFPLRMQTSFSSGMLMKRKILMIPAHLYFLMRLTKMLTRVAAGGGTSHVLEVLVRKRSQKEARRKARPSRRTKEKDRRLRALLRPKALAAVLKRVQSQVIRRLLARCHSGWKRVSILSQTSLLIIYTCKI